MCVVSLNAVVLILGVYILFIQQNVALFCFLNIQGPIWSDEMQWSYVQPCAGHTAQQFSQHELNFVAPEKENSPPYKWEQATQGLVLGLLHRSWSVSTHTAQESALLGESMGPQPQQQPEEHLQDSHFLRQDFPWQGSSVCSLCPLRP